ncbi:hypothetical protein JCM6882_003773 [Rhodosporidiobolus microsporus]
MTSQFPKISHVLELCLYAKHLPTTLAFYRDTLRLGPPVFHQPDRMAVFPLGQTSLLLFQRGETYSDWDAPHIENQIPGHGLPEGDMETKLRTHFALAVETPEDVDKWEEELKEKGVKILGKADWPRGGRSVYFADPDEACGEIVSRGIWPNY